MTDLGVIACGSPQTAEAGGMILKQGGNAADAVVAAALATAAGEPSLTSHAGGGMFIHRSAAGEATAGNFFATAPGLGGVRATAGADGIPELDFYPIEIDFLTGGTRQTFYVGRGAAAVPGTLPGLFEIQKQFGRLDAATVLAPTIEFLQQGILLNDYQAQCKRILSPILRRSHLGRKRFFLSDRHFLKPGDMFRCPELAATLGRIADEGVAPVSGAIADAVLEAFGEDQGGCITAEDLARWHSVFAPPIETGYRGSRIFGCPAPAWGGPFIAHTLELFEAVGMAEAPDPAERMRRVVGVFRAVSELRTEDEHLLERGNASEILLDRVRSILRGKERGDPFVEPRTPGNTTHISVIDAEGNAAGVTLSYGEGNGHEIPNTGLLMNNFLGEADLFPGGFHKFTPGDRLPTMMAPTILVEADGTVDVIGAGGANRIRTAIPQVICDLVDEGDNAHEAVSRGRIHVEGGVLSAETYAMTGGETSLRSARELVTETKAFEGPSLFFGGVHVARRRPDGSLSGVGDPRRDGVVLRVHT